MNGRHLIPLERKVIDGTCLYLKVRTNQSDLGIVLATRIDSYLDDELIQPERRSHALRGRLDQEFDVALDSGSTLRIEKLTALYTSRDHATSEAGREARKMVHDAPSFHQAFVRHATAWKHLWERFDIQFELTGENDTIRDLSILRLHIFHLLQTTSPASIGLDVGVPARGWHGEAYRGHVFWDEVFIFPLLNLRVPEVTRALLMYRYRRLKEARRAAKAEGYAGAMFPWQSGSNGREESQRLHLNPRSGNWLPDNSHLQRHVNSSIAYDIWQYFQATGDFEFLSFYGAEMLLEIARFWASIATFREDSSRYEILGVMGPDEYHDAYPGSESPGLDNNTYTNVMAAWVLNRALDVLNLLPRDRVRELRETLGLFDSELADWENIRHRLKIPFHDRVISQFDGYERLAEFDWEGYTQKYGDIQRLDRILEAENDTPNHYKVSKQADVLMLFFLFSADELRELFDQLGYDLPSEMIPRTIDYYMSRTSHGSTLSRVVHSWVLARSDRPAAWKLFRTALESDVNDIQGGTTPEGIHLGAMAGSVDLVQRCFTGLEIRGDTLWLNPVLPDDMTSLTMNLRYRGHSLLLHLSPVRLRVEAVQCSEHPISIGYAGVVHLLHAGEELVLSARSG